MTNATQFDTAHSFFGTNDVKAKVLNDYLVSQGFENVAVHKTFAEYRVRKGIYNLGEKQEPKAAPVSVPKHIEAVKNDLQAAVVDVISNATTYDFIPKLDEKFVSYGCASKVNKIIRSKKFMPIFITGESGEGKSLMVNQLAAKAKREVIRVNCTPETDESELIGDLRLVDGNTVFQKGPVIEAMERGAILLLDEVDSLHPARGCFCLYSILEGSGAFIKKMSMHVDHAPGFTVIATANTKGTGSSSGRWIGTFKQNEAFLDRFDLMFHHEPPTPAVRKRILNLTLDVDSEDNTSFIDNLITWSTIIDKTYSEGIVSDRISTRRLTKIIRLYEVFGDRLEVIKMVICRFNEEVVESILSLYEKVDSDPDEYKKSAGIEGGDENQN